MVHAFIIEPLTYNAFGDEAEQIEKCKEWSLLSEKATKTKAFFYKGNGMNLACSIVGYVDKITAVIELDNGQKHCIHPSYLKEMQAANYGQKPAAAAEEPADTADSSEPSESAGTGTTDTGVSSVEESDKLADPAMLNQISADESVIAQALVERPADNPFEQSLLDESALEQPGIDQSESVHSEPDKAPVEDKPKGKAKKEKTPKLQLPEEKVKMIATVTEFTTVPNNFSDNDDEVIIYEAVSITDPELEIGTAWSSHSATLKKMELEVGDTITFEGKIVAKKLTKHPVPYKINNPSKLQKQEA